MGRPPRAGASAARKKMRTFAGAQYFTPDFWPGWSDEEKKSLGDVPAMLQIIASRIDSKDAGLEELYGIKHDSDLKPDGSGKEPHIHFVGRFSEGGGLAIADIASAAGVESQYIEKLPPGRFSYPNALAYLTHIKYVDKHQYLPSEVVTFRGRDFDVVYEENRESWTRGRASVERKSADENRDHFVALVNDGQLRVGDFERAPKGDPKYAVWNEFEREIREAAKRSGGRRAAIEVDRLRRGLYKKNVLFLTGDEGAGKSNTAWALASKLAALGEAETGEKWLIYEAADKNSLDDYEAEHILILDDHDGSGLSGAGWKKLLDPHHASPVSKRFHNGAEVAPRVIIVCTTATVYEWASAARGGSSARYQRKDKLGQYIRRFEFLLRMDKISFEDAPQVLAMMLRELEEPQRPIVDERELPDGSTRIVREDVKWDFEPVAHFENPEEMLENLSPILMLESAQAQANALAPMRLEPLAAAAELEAKASAEEESRLENLRLASLDAARRSHEINVIKSKLAAADAASRQEALADESLRDTVRAIESHSAHGAGGAWNAGEAVAAYVG